MWLSGLSMGLQTERLPVRFPARAAHAWAEGVTNVSLSVSLPLSLKINK